MPVSKRLRTELERLGLRPAACDCEAQQFFAGLSLEQKAQLGLDLAGPPAGVAPEEMTVERGTVKIVPPGWEPPYNGRRDGPADDCQTRTFSVRADSIDEATRSIEAVITTEDPVRVIARDRYEEIDEVLRSDGVALPEQVPVLDSHWRYSVDSVLGSARHIRREGSDTVARLHFAEGNEAAERAWNLVRQRHVRDVSVGYRVTAYSDVEAGQSAQINGKSYTAGQRRLRVATAWDLKEVSITPIGADPRAKTRSKGASTMPQALRAYLESIGLRAEATDDEAWALYRGLSGDQRSEADKHRGAAQPPNPTGQVPAATPASTQQRTEPAPAATTPADVAAQAVAAERQRVRALRELAGADVPADVLQRAVDEGWDAARASQEFLVAVRAARQPAPYHHTAYTGPSPSQAGASARALAAGVLHAYSVPNPTQCFMHNGRRDPLPADRLTDQDVEQGARFRRLSISDLIRHAAYIDTGRAFIDTDEALDAVRAAPSGGTLAYIFTTSMYARLLEGWARVTDTTTWCDVEDVPNFLEHDDISLAASARLDRHPRGGTAKDASLSDSKESYRIARYSKKFVVDEMDAIDDRFGAIMKMPMEMGEAAAEVRPNLVYSLLLANANLADTGALFNNSAVTAAGGHANLTTAALGAAGLKAAILAMGKYREGDRVLNIRPRFLIVPSALQWTAKELLTSTAQAYTAAAAAATPSLYYPINVIAAENLTLVVDDRIGAAGVWDPVSEVTRTGLDTNWFLSAGGPRTVRVVYRAGTNRQPQMRAFTLDQGQWGMGWDVNFDIGAKALDYRGLHKSTGAG